MSAATLLYRPGCEGAMQDTKIVPNITSRPRVEIAQGLTLTEAQELLDWLENQGVKQHEVDLDDDGLITVRWMM
jgi:hypothetical protein